MTCRFPRRSALTMLFYVESVQDFMTVALHLQVPRHPPSPIPTKPFYAYILFFAHFDLHIVHDRVKRAEVTHHRIVKNGASNHFE